ncbi:hypothetical protein ACTXT7_014847 [Hymenolepis weldensis]
MVLPPCHFYLRGLRPRKNGLTCNEFCELYYVKVANQNSDEGWRGEEKERTITKNEMKIEGKSTRAKRLYHLAKSVCVELSRQKSEQPRETTKYQNPYPAAAISQVRQLHLI